MVCVFLQSPIGLQANLDLRHWPIGLIYDNFTISQSVKTPNSNPGAMAAPLRLVLHLASPPTEKLLLGSSPDACKQAFMGQLKEADFIRWGNTKRITGLRQNEQDGLWEGIKERKCSFCISKAAQLMWCC